MTSKYVFDSYAIFEMIDGNESYLNYQDAECVINTFTFAELCYTFYRDKMKEAQGKLNRYSKYIVSLNPEWIEEAMQFRLKWKDRNVSVPDCVGYIMAKKLGIKFLTGDKEFEGMENVEFVK